MIISSVQTNDLKEITTLTPQGWPDITVMFENYINSANCFPIKLINNNKIVGIGATIIHGNAAWVAHIIVHPEERNKGIGKIITKKLIAQANEHNCATIQLIATELGAFVYEKLNFKTITEYIFYKVAKNLKKHISSSFVIPYQESFYNDVLNLDKFISGENRETTIKKHLKNASLFIKHNIIEGLFIPDLGEGLILATTPTAGIELLKLRLNTHENVIIPINNNKAKEYIESENYKIIYKAKRMWLGEKPNIKSENIYARIGGNLG